jgi:hypothetical protein
MKCLSRYALIALVPMGATAGAVAGDEAGHWYVIRMSEASRPTVAVIRRTTRRLHRDVGISILLRSPEAPGTT